MTPTEAPWFFCFEQSALWHDRGQPSLLFRQAGRKKSGAKVIAIRTFPFDMPLPGPLQGTQEAHHGWQQHAAGKAAIQAYGTPGAIL